VVSCPYLQVIRPFVVCAVLRDVVFTPSRYKSFIDLQDKLHANIARKRSLVAIGTHDLDTLTPPFRYEARAPQDITFVPLSQTKEFRADHLMDFYNKDPSVKHIKPYVPLVASSSVYPVIYDSKNTLLSLPPIINGEHSKISLATKNVFIECTATDLTKAHVVLNTMVSMFAEYCSKKPFTVEAVKVTYEPGHSGFRGITEEVTPDLSTRPAVARMSSIRSIIGNQKLTGEQASEAATKMQLEARPGRAVVTEEMGGKGEEEDVILVNVPVTRADILHECDLVEDVAIAYGYNNIERKIPNTPCPGAQQPINKLTDALRHEMAAAGYDETLTLALVAKDENFAHYGVPDDGKTAVELLNPQTQDFQIGRTTMVPGILKSLVNNKGKVSFSAGVKLFEISDVILKDGSADVGARNERRLAAVYSGMSAGFEVVHGIVDRIMTLLEVPVRHYAWEVAAAGAGSSAASAASSFGRGGFRYYLESLEGVATYFPGRGAKVILEHSSGEKIVLGSLGVLHPKVLAAFGMDHPASVVELNIEPFLKQ
jgi:phenylalanyl-tRNA synthetase beta chain